MAPRDLLPGNADLKDLAAQLPHERHASNWDVAWMVVVSSVLVIVGMVSASKFETIYREIGVQLPARTEDVIQVWFHLLALGIQVLPIIWQFRSGSASWATRVWCMCAILYAGFVILALFMPLVGITHHMGGLGEQAS